MKNYRLTQNQTEPAVDPQLAVIDQIDDLIRGLDEKGQLEVKHRLDTILDIEVKNINLAEELGLMYRRGKVLLGEVNSDKGVPVNQKAQIFNSVQSQLMDIAKARAGVYSQERLKRYEGAFLKALNTLGTDEMKAAFMDLYEDFLKDKGE